MPPTLVSTMKPPLRQLGNDHGIVGYALDRKGE